MFPVFFHVIDDEENRRQRAELSVQKRRLRDESDPFDLPDRQFIKLFRLNKALCGNLIDAIGPLMTQRVRITGIPVPIRVVAVLRFLATGNYQTGIGEEWITCMSQQKICKCIDEVSRAIEQIAPQWIKFPDTDIQRDAVKADFYRKFGFPGAVGAVDGTHLSLLEPLEEEHAYFNRKGYHSINCLIVCDSNLKILYINGNFGGAAHDAFVWSQSALCDHMRDRYLRGDQNSWLIGDSAYPQTPFLMKPFDNPAEDSPESRYNRAHIRARNCVERCIGVLKSRFRCLLKERVLRYEPEKVGVFANACAVLHNICIANNIPFDDEIAVEDDGDEDEDDGDDDDDNNRNLQREGEHARHNIVNLYFNVDEE